MVPETASIARLLSGVEQAPVSIVESTVLAPWAVMRCRLDGDGPDAGRTAAGRTAAGHTALPSSVIVKWLRSDSRTLRTDPRQVGTERCALEFLQELGFPQAPRLFAADLESNVLVLEDLAPRRPLSDLITADGAAIWRTGMRAFARAVGRLHAHTAGREREFYRRRAHYAELDPELDRTPVLGPRWPETLRHLAGLGLSPDERVRAELASLHQKLDGSDTAHRDFFVLTNGDPEANNFLYHDAADEGRLLDFEFAGYRHAATNLTWINVPGPLWLTVADEGSRQLELDYLGALGDALPRLHDPGVFGEGMAAACFAVAFQRLNRFPTVDARPAGERSRLQLVLTVEAAADTAVRHHALPRLAEWAREIAAGLRKRWPDADQDSSTIPSYTRR